MKITNPLTVEDIILGLGLYFLLLIYYRSKSAWCAVKQRIRVG